jgi:hypothetical protein
LRNANCSIARIFAHAECPVVAEGVEQVRSEASSGFRF